MRAVRLTAWGERPVLAEVPTPVPGPGEVLVRVAGAGVCHSDLHVLDARPGALPFEPPFTLGHEITGWVETLGDGATGFAAGEPVAVYGPWGCGDCPHCTEGAENYCDRRAGLGRAGVGLGVDGGMAGAVLVPSTRLLVPLGDLDPVASAPLTDAALTPYHAIGRAQHRLGPGSVALVIGVGGLGHVAVQLLRLVTPSLIVAVDNHDEGLARAERAGAHHAVAAAGDAADTVRKLTDGRGVDVVFDFVGSDPTLALATATLRAAGAISIVGSGGGVLALGRAPSVDKAPVLTRPGASVDLPYWGTRAELAEVIRLAQRGRLHLEIERFGLSEALDVLEHLRHGRVRGRAVLTP